MEYRHNITYFTSLTVFHYDQNTPSIAPNSPSSYLIIHFTISIHNILIFSSECFLVAHNILLITRCSLVNWKQKLIYYPHITLNVRYEKELTWNTLYVQNKVFPYNDSYIQEDGFINVKKRE